MPPPEARHLRAAAWLHGLDLDAEAQAHAVDHLRVELLRLGDRWTHATPADLVAELRDEAARIMARGAITALRIDGNAGLRPDQRAEVDAALREVVTAVEVAYSALTAACARRLVVPPAADPEHPTPSARASVKRERAAAILREQLADGPRPVAELVRLAVAAGISRSTLDVAASELRIARDGRGRQTTWRLAAPEASDRERAASMIAKALADGTWHPAAPILAAIVGAGIARADAWEAAEQLNVEHERQDGRASWRLAVAERPAEAVAA